MSSRKHLGDGSFPLNRYTKKGEPLCDVPKKNKTFLEDLPVEVSPLSKILYSIKFLPKQSLYA